MKLDVQERLDIARKSGRTPIACSCKKCQEQCRSVCLGTPSDILRIAQAGYSQYIKPTMWAVGMLVGKTKEPVLMLQLEYNEETGYCCMFEDGKCKLHEAGIKPIEGKLSSHLIRKDNFIFSKSLSWLVAKTWLDPRNEETIREIIKIIDSTPA